MQHAFQPELDIKQNGEVKTFRVGHRMVAKWLEFCGADYIQKNFFYYL